MDEKSFEAAGFGVGDRLRLRKDLKVAPTWQPVQSRSAAPGQVPSFLVITLNIFIYSPTQITFLLMFIKGLRFSQELSSRLSCLMTTPQPFECI